MLSEQPQSGLIAVGLDVTENARHERLIFGIADSAYDYVRRWRVEERGGGEAAHFGFRRSVPETSENEDIHLVLSVETHENGSRGAHFKCYRNGQLYGVPIFWSDAVEFHPDDEINLVIRRPGAPGRTVIKHAHVYGEALSEKGAYGLAHPTAKVDNQQSLAGSHQEGIIKSLTTNFNQGHDEPSLYRGEYDGGSSTQHSEPMTRHSYVLMWDGTLSDWDDHRVQDLEQALLTLDAKLIVIEGFYTKNCNEGPVIVKGHLVTQKIDIMKEKGLSLLQTEVGPQLKHLEIGEREVDGTSLRAVLDEHLSISDLPIVLREEESSSTLFNPAHHQGSTGRPKSSPSMPKSLRPGISATPVASKTITLGKSTIAAYPSQPSPVTGVSNEPRPTLPPTEPVAPLTLLCEPTKTSRVGLSMHELGSQYWPSETGQLGDLAPVVRKWPWWFPIVLLFMLALHMTPGHAIEVYQVVNVILLLLTLIVYERIVRKQTWAGSKKLTSEESTTRQLESIPVNRRGSEESTRRQLESMPVNHRGSARVKQVDVADPFDLPSQAMVREAMSTKLPEWEKATSYWAFGNETKAIRPLSPGVPSIPQLFGLTERDDAQLVVCPEVVVYSLPDEAMRLAIMLTITAPDHLLFNKDGSLEGQHFGYYQERIGVTMMPHQSSIADVEVLDRHASANVSEGDIHTAAANMEKKLSTNTALSMLKSSKGKSSVAEKSQNTNVVTYAYSIATKAHAWEIKLHKPMIAAGLKLDSSKINYDKSKKALSIPFRDHLLNEQGREFLGIWEFSPFVSKVTIDLEIERSFALARATKIKRKIVGSTVAVDTTYWNPVWRRSIEIDLG